MSITRRRFIRKFGEGALGLSSLFAPSWPIFAQRKRASRPPLSPAAQLKKDLRKNNERIISRVMSSGKKIVRNDWANGPLLMGMLETAELMEAEVNGSGQSIIDAVSSVV